MRKRTGTVFAVALASVLPFSAPPTADAKPGKPSRSDEVRKLGKQQCRGQRRADSAAFRAAYGKRATPTCRKRGRDGIKGEFKNAAKECKAERKADPDAFYAKYGSNYNERNAFGMCVSQKVKSRVAEKVDGFRSAARQCRADRKADPDAFRAGYGTTKGNKTALGKCVSRTVKAAADGR